MVETAYWFLWFFVFVLPWQNVVQITGVGTISRLAGIVAFVVGLFAVLSTGRLRRPTVFHFWAICFVAWSGLTVFWTLDPRATAVRFSGNLQLMALVWLVWELSQTSERRMGLFQAYVLGAYVSGTMIIVKFILGDPLVGRGQYERYAASGFQPNDVAFLMVLAIPMAWHLGTSCGQPFVRWMNRLYLPVGLLAILLTASRSGLLMTGLALLIVPWTLSRLSLGTRIAMVIILVASVVGATRYTPAASLARLATTRTELAQGTLNTRRPVWRAGIKLFPRQPVGGVGAGAFPSAVVPFLGFRKTPHNSYLSVLIEQGVVGLTFFLLMFISVFLHVRSAPPRERRFFLVLLLTLVLGLTPRAWSEEKQTWLILALLLAPAASVQPAVPTVRRVPVRLAVSA